MEIRRVNINSIGDFVNEVIKNDQEMQSTNDPKKRFTWFRGEAPNPTPLLPKVYRKKANGSDDHDENALLQTFRMQAPTFASGVILPPDREATDQWLFLAQHVELPTRLLDWTESPLAALYFALLQDHKGSANALTEGPYVWMLKPLALNSLAIDESKFPVTWLPATDPKTGKLVNPGSANICSAWEDNTDYGARLPTAVMPTNIHPRMSAQRSCFTVWGSDRRSLIDQVQDLPHDRDFDDLLVCYTIDADPEKHKELIGGLRALGIGHTTLFPDLDGLAKELGARY